MWRKYKSKYHLILSPCTVCRTIQADIGTSIIAAQTVVHTVHILDKVNFPDLSTLTSEPGDQQFAIDVAGLQESMTGGGHSVGRSFDSCKKGNFMSGPKELLMNLILVWNCNLCTFLNWDAFTLLHLGRSGLIKSRMPLDYLLGAILNWHRHAHLLHHNLHLGLFNSFSHLQSLITQSYRVSFLAPPKNSECQITYRSYWHF